MSPSLRYIPTIRPLASGGETRKLDDILALSSAFSQTCNKRGDKGAERRLKPGFDTVIASIDPPQ